MSRTFECGEPFYEGGSFTIHPGVTALVGCNGSGKTTLLMHIKDALDRDFVPVFHHDGRYANGRLGYEGGTQGGEAFDRFVQSLFSSEGQQVTLTFSHFVPRIADFVSKAGKEAWVLLDGLDTATSIDVLVELSELFKTMVGTRPMDQDLYVVVAANAYELVASADRCIDVGTSRQVEFESYEAYRDFVLETAARSG